MEKAQKKYLNEKTKAIQKELGAGREGQRGRRAEEEDRTGEDAEGRRESHPG
jgi:ATP-dependent Lon protease